MNCNNSEQRGEEGEDIISGLPDDVLIRILSNLETLDAVRTCILSSRWENLWKSIDKLDFNFPVQHYEKCAPFINQVLERLQSENVKSFRLYARYDPRKSYYIDAQKNYYIDNHVPKWTAYAAGHNVRRLTLDVDICYFTLPQSVLTCASLTKLTLQTGFCRFDIPESLVCFPSLISLYIYIGYHFLDDSELQNLFNGCPVLEDLTISAQINVDTTTLELILPSLKTLSIHEEKDCLMGYHAPDKFVVEAHNLERLDISATETFPYLLLGDAPYLEKVSLCAAISGFEEYVSMIEGYSTTEFLGGIRYTRCLSLMTGAVRVLSYAFDGNMPMFPNLINLELGMESTHCVKLLRHFLTNSPNLRILTLELGHVDFDVVEGNPPYEVLGPNDFVWFDLRSLPPCLLSHVKRIEIKNIKQFEEVEAMKYLLEHGKVLESFSVELSKRRSEAAEMLRNQILGFPRSSTLCKIEFM